MDAAGAAAYVRQEHAHMVVKGEGVEVQRLCGVCIGAAGAKDWSGAALLCPPAAAAAAVAAVAPADDAVVGWPAAAAA
eukprot:scaffold100976_cov18-Tisochrysis_lutea.AAC.1